MQKKRGWFNPHSCIPSMGFPLAPAIPVLGPVLLLTVEIAPVEMMRRCNDDDRDCPPSARPDVQRLLVLSCQPAFVGFVPQPRWLDPYRQRLGAGRQKDILRNELTRSGDAASDVGQGVPWTPLIYFRFIYYQIKADPGSGPDWAGLVGPSASLSQLSVTARDRL